MRPGEAVMFWSTLMHASYPNSTADTMRLGFAIRFVPTCVRVYPDTDVVEEYGGSVSLERFGSVLVSGVNEYDHHRIATHTTTGHPFRIA
jgi:non-heme Fe2+,alpha-ketoglutarate-dependent halogenase